MNRKSVMMILSVAVFFGCYFLVGPIVQKQIDMHKPYLLIDPTCECQETICGIALCTPIEITGKSPEEAVRVPVAKVDVEYLPYIHYPESWGPWNPFNPDGYVGPAVETASLVFLPMLILGVAGYGYYLWKKGRLRGFMKRLMP